MDTNIHKGISQLVQVSRSRGSARCVGPAMTSNTRESGVQTTTVHAVAMRTAAFKTVQCNELNVTAWYILITKQINKAYKYYLWWQTKQVYIHLHQFLYRFHFLMRHIVDSNKRWSIRVTKCILELS